MFPEEEISIIHHLIINKQKDRLTYINKIPN